MANHTHAAKMRKDDEFYTRYEDVAVEMKKIENYLRGRKIFLPCDDFEKSAFSKYFADNFDHLGLKSLISSCHYPTDLFSTSEGGFWSEYRAGAGWSEKVFHNGDFRISKSVMSLARRSDLIITNPPFSLYRFFYDFCELSGVDFYVMSAMFGLNYVKTFKQLKNGAVHFYPCNCAYFARPDGTRQKVGCIWMTNIKMPERTPPPLEMYVDFAAENYKCYENYPAINVKNLVDIPRDYFGVMGVPVTFLLKWNPAQFELVGMPHGNMGRDLGVARSPMTRNRHNVYFLDDGEFKMPYQRIFIRHKKQA